MNANILYNLFLSLELPAYSAKQFQIDMSVFKILGVYGSLYDEDLSSCQLNLCVVFIQGL
jgi:hypothetical protein